MNSFCDTFAILLEDLYTDWLICAVQPPVAGALAQLIHSTVDPVYHQHSGLSTRLRPKAHQQPSTKAPPQVLQRSLFLSMNRQFQNSCIITSEIHPFRPELLKR